MSGCNVDPLNAYGAPLPDDLLRWGLRWIRLVSRPGVEDYGAQCQEAGIMVLAVVTAQSQGYVFSGPDVWQFGNEPDIAGTDDAMTPGSYASQFVFYQRTYPELLWIGAGLASGQPSYWQQVQTAGGLLGACGFAVHPYAKTTSQAKTLLANYQKITPQLALWVTEWHRPVEEVVSFASMLRSSAVMNAWFCFSELMVSGFGLTQSSARMLGAAA